MKRAAIRIFLVIILLIAFVVIEKVLAPLLVVYWGINLVHLTIFNIILFAGLTIYGCRKNRILAWAAGLYLFLIIAVIGAVMLAAPSPIWWIKFIQIEFDVKNNDLTKFEEHFETIYAIDTRLKQNVDRNMQKAIFAGHASEVSLFGPQDLELIKANGRNMCLKFISQACDDNKSKEADCTILQQKTCGQNALQIEQIKKD